ncbi:hypothetical protein B5F76_09600 [Desulfovibrio sp. An276]|nr:hypothetical protein B5F76_09600 [Desulfovibrio sp. An276]
MCASLVDTKPADPPCPALFHVKQRFVVLYHCRLCRKRQETFFLQSLDLPGNRRKFFTKRSALPVPVCMKCGFGSVQIR